MPTLTEPDYRVRQLGDLVRTALSRTNAHASGELRLAEPPTGKPGFAGMVLAEFERRNAHQLVHEHRLLSGAETSMGNTFLPASYQKEVIREALANLNILQLVRTQIDPTAAFTTNVPYEERQSAANIPNDGIVFEGKAIQLVGGGVRYDVAYIAAMKLAIKVTNEVIHFSQATGVNWEAWGKNIALNARLIRELLHFRITNEMQRSADTYMAQAVVNEAFTASDSGLIKTEKFPVVRPHQVRDMQGNTIGNPECPLILTIGGVSIPYFTGEKNLEAGTYWAFASVNMGYIQLVNEKAQAVGGGAVGNISYSYANNLIKFDLSTPDGQKYETHLNKLVSMIGDQKAILSSQRYSSPDYAVMSSMLNNEISKADQFAVSLKRNGSDTNMQGDLEAIKGLPAFDCNVPGDLGDQRILIGQRGLTAYTIAKPWNMGTPFEAVDELGHPTGEKVAYGEEYSSIHTLCLSR